MASTNSTTVENLNILDTSSTNDTSGTEIISLQEVLNALFSATNATQTVTIDSSFWTSGLTLTFRASTGVYYTIGATSSDHFTVTQTDQYGNVTGSHTGITATTASSFLSQVSTFTGSTLTNTSLLTTTEIDGGASKDNIQGISNNVKIANIITGGAGADVMTGGLGADHFVYTSVSNSPAVGQLNSGGQLAQTWDTITNFSHAQGDKIDLSQLASNLGISLTWNGPVAPTALQYNSGQNTVWYGSDGNGGIIFTSILIMTAKRILR